MKKYGMIFALTALLGGTALAGYDLSTERFPDANYPTRPYTVTIDAAADIVSTGYLAVYDTLANDAVLVSATEIAGFGTGATKDEIDRIADDSDRVNALDTSTSVTCATHGTGQINYISSSFSSWTGTLPAATGSGCEYTFVWSAKPYSSGDTIQVTGNDEFRGTLYALSDDSAAVKGWAAASGSDNDSITFNSSTKFGAQAGSVVKVRDVATDVYQINGFGASTGTEATPFATGQRS